MIPLDSKQLDVKQKVEKAAEFLGVDSSWAVAVAMVESSLGLSQVSPTGCKGVFQMSSIAMKDLLQSMPEVDDDLIDIVCGVAFLKLLLKRWKTQEKATAHFCDPHDRDFYLDRVKFFMEEFND